MTTIENKTFDEERALYGSHDVLLKNSAFDGPAGGESAVSYTHLDVYKRQATA